MAKHIHQYRRTNIGVKNKYIVYACNLPLCTHYLRPELVEGKLSLCCRCDKPFVMTKEKLRLANPHCDDCKIGVKDDVERAEAS